MRRLRQVILIIVLSIAFILSGFFSYYYEKVHPKTIVSGVDVSGKTVEEAAKILAEKIALPKKITVRKDDQAFDLETSKVALSYDFSGSAIRAYEYSRTGNIITDISIRISSLFKAKEMGLKVNLDEIELSRFVSMVAGEISVDPVFPKAKIAEGKIVVENGKAGNKVSENLLTALIGEALSNAREAEIQIPVEQIDPSLNESQIKDYEVKTEKFIGKSLILKFEDYSQVIKDSDIVALTNPDGSFDSEKISLIIERASSQVERESQEPKFTFKDNKASEFLPAKDSIKVRKEELLEMIIKSLDEIGISEEKSQNIEIPVTKTPPKTTTDQVNNLGINELIGRGTSKFRGSIASRVHNISHASSVINGTIVKPGETFSFNDALGDVSKLTGYQEAYVIREGKTVLGDGGGVCQVSTTLFRAALNAGLPITERRAHAYRVGYYEQDGLPGLDATVYSPSPDLKIKNDTPGHILIQAIADTKNSSLVFEIYGTKDGRSATVSKPVVSNVVKPEDDLYIDDPTLPIGTVKQTEHRANGAKVVFTYKVTRNGETLINTKFTSNYRPWQAVYLRGTGPAI